MKTHISSEERDRAFLEQRRMKAGRLFGKGMSQYAVAKKLGVSTAATNQWHKAWNVLGEDGLVSKGPPGFDSKYTDGKKKELRKILVKGPRAQKYSTDFWTLRRIRETARKKLGVHLGIKQTWSTVISLGFSCQKPERRSKERNERLTRQWKLQTFPRLKKMGQAA